MLSIFLSRYKPEKNSAVNAVIHTGKMESGNVTRVHYSVILFE